MNTDKFFKLHKFNTYTDQRGELTVFDKIDELVDWKVKRSYWVTKTKSPRGGHCVKGERKFYVMAEGSCKVKLFDGINWHKIVLKGPTDALEMRADLWREFTDFTEHTVMFTLCNNHYLKADYILDIEEYKNYINS